MEHAPTYPDLKMEYNHDFSELLPEVQAALRKFKEERRLSELARNIGFSKNRLTEIMHGRRKLTLYYIIKLMESGVLSIDQMFGDSVENLKPGSRALAKRILIDSQIVDILDKEMQELLKEAAAQNRLEDFKTILKTILKK
jgi:transcriptional regulator with XRE-family HTH domain